MTGLQRQRKPNTKSFDIGFCKFNPTYLQPYFIGCNQPDMKSGFTIALPNPNITIKFAHLIL